MAERYSEFRLIVVYFLFSTSVYISYQSGSLTRQAKRSWVRIPAPQDMSLGSMDFSSPSSPGSFFCPVSTVRTVTV